MAIGERKYRTKTKQKLISKRKDATLPNPFLSDTIQPTGDLTTSSSKVGNKKCVPPMRPPPPLVAQTVPHAIANKPKYAFDDLDDTIRLAFANSPPKRMMSGGPSSVATIGVGQMNHVTFGGSCTSSRPSNHDQQQQLLMHPQHNGGPNYGTEQQLYSSLPSKLTQGVLFNLCFVNVFCALMSVRACAFDFYEQTN